MFEECEDFLVLVQKLSHLGGNGSAVCRRIIRLPQAAVDKVGSDYFRYLKLFRFGETEGYFVFLEETVNRVAEPGIMPELKGVSQVRWQESQKGA